PLSRITPSAQDSNGTDLRLRQRHAPVEVRACQKRARAAQASPLKACAHKGCTPSDLVADHLWMTDISKELQNSRIARGSWQLAHAGFLPRVVEPCGLLHHRISWNFEEKRVGGLRRPPLSVCPCPRRCLTGKRARQWRLAARRNRLLDQLSNR